MLTATMFRDPRLSRMAAFLGSIGIEMRAGTIDVPTLFPGSLISRGSLVVDESVLVAPGDALHEAAHIALSPPERRSDDFGFIEGEMGGEELTTISWSWPHCWSSTYVRKISSTEPHIRVVATRQRSSIAPAAESTLASHYCWLGGWRSTSGTHSYAA